MSYAIIYWGIAIVNGRRHASHKEIGLHSSPVMLAVTSGRSIERILIQQIPFRGIRVAEFRYAE